MRSTSWLLRRSNKNYRAETSCRYKPQHFLREVHFISSNQSDIFTDNYQLKQKDGHLERRFPVKLWKVQSLVQKAKILEAYDPINENNFGHIVFIINTKSKSPHKQLKVIYTFD